MVRFGFCFVVWGFFNSWDAQSFYASSALKSYLTVSTGCTCKSCIPSDISHAGILPRVNPMRRAVNQARCSLFPVDTSSPSYCFQRACLTQQWCSDMENLCTCNFDFISQGWHKIFFSSWGKKRKKGKKKRKKIDHLCQVAKNKLSASLQHSHQAKWSLLVHYLLRKGKNIFYHVITHFGRMQEVNLGEGKMRS